MTSREKFEAWWEVNYHNGNPPRFGWEYWRDGDGYQIDDDESELDCMWEAWQAAESAMAVQLANAESKCRELQRDNDSLEAVAVSMRDDMRDAREKLEELDNAICELLPGTQYMDPPDGGSVTPLEQVRRMVAAYRNRIAELEARTVTLPQYRNSPDMHTKQFYEAIGFNQGLDIFIEALRAAGIGVKGE
ncbi:hypothetical protein VC894_16850 [Citrobacter freundii]|nr:hypothetical protein [Citrobacter freundii]